MKTNVGGRLVNGEPVELKTTKTGFDGVFFMTFNGGRNGWVKSSWDNCGRNKNKRAHRLDIDLGSLDKGE